MNAFDNLSATDVVREQNIVSAEYHKALILAYYFGCCIGSHCFAYSALSILLFLLSLASSSIIRWNFFATNGHHIRNALSRCHSNNSIFFSSPTSIKIKFFVSLIKHTCSHYCRNYGLFQNRMLFFRIVQRQAMCFRFLQLGQLQHLLCR